jgi:hypothetical protein
MFYVKVFAPLDDLTGDRRTTLEIYERVKAGYVRLVLPISRIYFEGLTGLIENSVLLLIEHGRIEPPPPELMEGGFKVDYLGKLALALQEQEVEAFQRFAQFGFMMEQVVPGFVSETVNLDRAGRRVATTFGMNEGDLNTEEERAAIREEKAKALQQQQEAQQMEAMKGLYGEATKAPEAGSPAEALVGAAG